MNSLKILMIAPTPFFADRGCHVRIFEEIKFLQKKGHRVILLTYPLGNDIEGLDIRRIPGMPWYRKLSAGPSLHKFYLDPFLAIKGISQSIREKPDIIHVHLHEGIAVGLLIRLFTKYKIVADLQGSLVEELIDHDAFGRSGLAYSVLKFVEKKLSRSSDHVIVSSKNSADILKKLYDLEDHQISWVGDGVDLREFYPGDPPPGLREQLAIPADARIVVFLGLLTEYQGVDLLLESFTQVADEIPDAHLLVMGYPNVDHYRELAASLNLNGRVTFTGRLPYEKASDFLNLGDLAVAPKMSLTEANGKLYNYMACGLPIVAFDTRVNREILGFKGIYSRYGDRDSLAFSIIEALRNPEKSAALGMELRKEVETSFSWEGSVERILSCYEKLL